MPLEVSSVTMTCAGSDGSATGAGTIPADFKGRLYAIKAEYSAGQAATTDITISHNGLVLLVITSTATGATYYPRPNICDTAGVAVSGVYEAQGAPLNGKITATVAQADNTETVTLTAFVEA